MVRGKKSKKRSHPSGAGSSHAEPTSEDHQDSGGHAGEEDARDLESIRTLDGEGQVPRLTGDEEQNSAVTAPQPRYTPPSRPRLYASAAPRPLSNREHHQQVSISYSRPDININSWRCAGWRVQVKPAV